MNIELEKVPHPNLPYGDIMEGTDAMIKKSEVKEVKLDKDGKEIKSKKKAKQAKKTEQEKKDE